MLSAVLAIPTKPHLELHGIMAILPAMLVKSGPSQEKSLSETGIFRKEETTTLQAISNISSRSNIKQQDNNVSFCLWEPLRNIPDDRKWWQAVPVLPLIMTFTSSRSFPAETSVLKQVFSFKTFRMQLQCVNMLLWRVSFLSTIFFSTIQSYSS